MHASEFARKRARIERRAGARKGFASKALAHLVREAGAQPIHARGQLVGWRMPDGGVVCIKLRFRDLVAAQLELARIERHAKNRNVPVRAYACQHCGGFHLTSQARQAANDNNPLK